MPKLLIICGGKDSAGTGQAMKAAFDRYGDGWEVRMVRRGNSYLDYPGDITWPRNDFAMQRKVQRLVDEADIIQVQQVPKILKRLRNWQRKPFVAMQIGTYFRNDPVGVTRTTERMGGRIVVNSLELLALAPPGHADLLLWTGDLDMLTRLRQEHRRKPDGRIRIYHSPTDRAMKSTAAFIAATDRLKQRYDNIDVEITEGVAWMENLRRKAAADIVYDQCHLGYGLNSAEAWAMKIPALVGLDDPGARNLFHEHYGGFPYPDTSEATIEERLEELIVDKAARIRWAEIGYSFVQENHAQSVVVPQAMELYESMIARKRRKAA